MGSHLIDLPFWALELEYPATIEAEGPLPVRAETYPDYLTVHWEHPARGKRPPVKLTWYDGKQRPKSPEGADLQQWHKGIMFVGDKGTMLADYSRWVLLPEADFKDFKPPSPGFPRPLGHHQEWVHACKLASDALQLRFFRQAGEHNLLGDGRLPPGKKLQWDRRA